MISCWLLTQISFIKNSGLSLKTILALYLIRIASGVVNAYLCLYYFPASDSKHFHEGGLVEYKLLQHNPAEYFKNVLIPGAGKSYGGFFSASHSYWNDLKTNILEKILSLFDVISCGDFFVNALLFNFFIFFGSVIFYRFFIKLYPAQKNILIFCFFLFPSMLFFTSAIHRDGLSFLLLAVIFYLNFNLINTGSKVLKRLLLITLSLFILFIVRNFAVLALLPAMLTWFIANRFKKHGLTIFIVSYIIYGVLFFAAKNLSPQLDFPKYIADRQTEFIKLSDSADSKYQTKTIMPTAEGFISNAPQAINFSLMRPYITEIKKTTYIPFALEILLLEISFIALIFWRRKRESIEHNHIVYAIVFFSFTMLLIIGYTIPILGAIVRYRSIYLPLLLCILLCNINWKKLRV